MLLLPIPIQIEQYILTYIAIVSTVLFDLRTQLYLFYRTFN